MCEGEGLFQKLVQTCISPILNRVTVLRILVELKPISQLEGDAVGLLLSASGAGTRFAYS